MSGGDGCAAVHVGSRAGAGDEEREARALKGSMDGSSSRLPPWSSATRWTSARPRPVPSARVVKKGSHRRCASAAPMPGPSSATVSGARVGAVARTSTQDAAAVRLGVAGVGDEVSHGLAELDAIGGDPAGFDVELDGPARGVLAAAARCGDRVLEHPGDLEGLEGELALAGDAEHRGDDALDLGDTLADAAGVAEGLGVGVDGGLAAEQLGEALDRVEGVADLVRDAAGHGPEGGRLVEAVQALLGAHEARSGPR